jgi:uncharacterized protein with LGFP repeats
VVIGSQRGSWVYYRDYERQFVTANSQRGSNMKRSIYFIPGRGTFEIHTDIWQRYNEEEIENNFLGFPKEDTRMVPRNTELVQVFDGGVIYWSQNTGEHELHNVPILDEYASLGWEGNPLGFPTTDALPTLKGDGGIYNSFEGGLITWHQATGAHKVMVSY